MDTFRLNFLTFLVICTFKPVKSASDDFSRYEIPTSGSILWHSEKLISGMESNRIVINELMVDPSPVVALPEYEWIELYHAGDTPVNLAGWRLEVGSVSRVLPAYWLEPGSYVLLCTSAAATQMSLFGKTIAFTLPALRNSGNLVTLRDAYNNPVDKVNYSDAWYRDSKKKNGGWTLERIDPHRDCGEELNWLASISPTGGTPGKINSVFADNADFISPVVTQAALIAPYAASVVFSEPMDPGSIALPENYFLSGIGFPDQVKRIGQDAVELYWLNHVIPNLSYTLSIRNLFDPCLNVLTEMDFTLQWVVLEEGDLVINEVLFNPLPSGVDFVEFINRSDKRIDPGLLTLAGRDRNMELRQKVSLKSVKTVIEPGAIFAVTLRRESVTPFYPSICPDCIYSLPSMPAFNNDEGWVVLMDNSDMVIDEFHYTEKMHHPLLHNVKGVSLERINPDAPSGVSSNWHSASSVSGYATPGYQNSQFMQMQADRALVKIENRLINPWKGQGGEVLKVHYATPGPGWVANVRVFNLQGAMVVQIAANQLLSAAGVILWNGSDRTGSMVAAGPYLLYVEIYDLNGSLERFREAIYVAGF